MKISCVSDGVVRRYLFVQIPLVSIEAIHQNQDNGIGILSHHLFVVAICPCHLQINKQIRQTDIFGIVILLTGFHAKGTGHVSFTAAVAPVIKRFRCSDIYSQVASLRISSCLACVRSIVDIHDIRFRLIETGILDQSFETVVFATAVFDIHQHTELILKGTSLNFGSLSWLRNASAIVVRRISINLSIVL